MLRHVDIYSGMTMYKVNFATGATVVIYSAVLYNILFLRLDDEILSTSLK